MSAAMRSTRSLSKTHSRSEASRPNVLPSRLRVQPFSGAQMQQHQQATFSSIRRAQCVVVRADAKKAEAAPAKKAGEGRMTYKPATYLEIVKDAVAAIKQGMANGLTKMEVEFPALPTSIDGKHHTP